MKTLYRQEGIATKIMAGYEEYRLVVQPPADACSIILEEQRWFSENYGEAHPAAAQPQLVVAGFMAKEPMEDTLLRYMHRVISRQSRFRVTVNNFSGFPPHTIYARVPQQQPFVQLAHAMQPVTEYLHSNRCPAATLHTRPYIAIAENLSPAVYERAMFRFSQHCLHADFEVEGLVLLRRGNRLEEYRRVTVFGMS